MFIIFISGDPQQKLEYAFELYDIDNNNSLDRNELRGVLTAMFDLLGFYFQLSLVYKYIH